jgi:predicted ATPase
MIDQVVALSRKRPVLFILEDAHWVDPTTEALLGETMERIAAAAVLMVITYRPVYAAPWADLPHATSLTLNRLDQPQSLALIRTIEAHVGSEELSQAVMERIIERADGVPLYLEELTRNVLEAGAAANGQGDKIPAILQASPTVRLDRLGPVKEMVKIGAVVGRTFSHQLISAVAGGLNGDVAHDFARAGARRRTPPTASAMP